MFPTRWNLAVRDVPDDTFEVTQPRAAQRHLFDGARRDTEIDDVADAELILHDDERSLDQVAQQVLRAERECDTDQSRAREHRGGVDAEHRRDQRGRDRSTR